MFPGRLLASLALLVLVVVVALRAGVPRAARAGAERAAPASLERAESPAASEGPGLVGVQREELQSASGEAGAWLRFVDEASLAPLSPDEVFVACEDGDQRLLPGQVLAAGTSVTVRARTSGYLPLSGTLEVVAGENRIALQRAASLSITLEEGEAPAEDVEVFLIVPRSEGGMLPQAPAGARALQSGPVPLAWNGSIWLPTGEPIALDDGTTAPGACAELLRHASRRTDAAGRAEWSDIPALDGYRWAVAVPPYLDPVPPHEQRRLTEVDGQVRFGPSPPEGVSGVFSLRPGELLELSGRVFDDASVHGRLTGTAGDCGAVVTLYRILTGGGQAAPPVQCFDVFVDRVADADGGFRFHGVPPATWMLRAWWQDGSELYFTNQAFRLEPGADLDLGLLDALVGETLELELGLEDQNGEALDPQRVYPGSSRPLAGVSFASSPHDRNAAHVITGFLPLPFHERLRVHGLQPGSLAVGVHPAPGLQPDPEWISRVEGAGMEPFEVGSRSALELALVAHTGSRRRLIVRTIAGEELDVPALWVRDLASGRASTRSTQQDSGSPALTLAPGSYELWCRLSVDSETGGYVGGTQADFGPGSSEPIVIEVTPAASVSGVVRDASGSPRPRQELRWAWGAWSLETTPYATTTDENGAFTLRAIPPWTRLRARDPGASLGPLEPGPRHEVELVLDS